MKIKYIIGAACVAAVIVFGTAIANAQLSDNFNAPTVNPGWTVDRFLPQSVSIQNVDGHSALQLGVTAAGYQGASSFYDYQGVQRPVTGVNGDWTAREQIDVTQAMLTGQANVSFWVRTGLVGNESTADYDIWAVRNPDGNDAAFYTFNDVNGSWLPTGVSATLGWHDFEMNYTGSSVVYSLDGTVERTDTALGNPLYDSQVTTVFNEVYNYGEAGYSGNFDNLNVSANAPDGGSTLVLLAASLIGIGFARRRMA